MMEFLLSPWALLIAVPIGVLFALALDVGGWVVGNR